VFEAHILLLYLGIGRHVDVIDGVYFFGGGERRIEVGPEYIRRDALWFWWFLVGMGKGGREMRILSGWM
jgi:hypothetical protein